MKYRMMLILLAIGLALPTPVRADVAPPAQPPGSNLQPGEESTQVRMMAEKVVMEIQPGVGDSLGVAQVTADFSMRNLGSQAETMAVRFPISANDGWSVVREIRNLEVRVGSRTVGTRRIQGEDPYWGGSSVPWAEFEVKFPAGKDVLIRVTYTLDGTGYFPFTSFNYILSSGAGWKDSIGSGEVIIRLPYAATVENVLMAGDSGYSFTSDGALLDGKQIRWTFENLEPTAEDNLHVELVAPAKWLKVLKERENVAKNPNDGEAWGRLGKLYKEIAFLPKELRPDPGGQALFELSKQAYERCLELKPNDAAWRAGFAELYWWMHNMLSWSDPQNDVYLIQALNLLKRAIEIDPKSAKARELLEEISWNNPGYVDQAGDGYVFLYLTATPTRIPSRTPIPASPTATVLPTETTMVISSPTAEAAAVAAPSRTPMEAPPTQAQPSQTQSSPSQTEPTAATAKPGVQVCGLGLMPALALPFAGLVWVYQRRRKI